MTAPPRMPEWGFSMSRLTSLALHSVTVPDSVRLTWHSAAEAQRGLTYSEHGHHWKDTRYYHE
jgi:hypothetical protein